MYHIAEPGQIPPGRLIHVEDHQGGYADIYLHRLHARGPVCWDLNWLTRQQVSYGLWQQNWTHEGRMQEPSQGLDVAVSRWEIVPATAMPADRTVMPAEEDGSCIWLLREGMCTIALRDAMNVMLERIAGDGLWRQAWYEHRERTPAPAVMDPLLTPPAVPLPV
ncbi:hypothetical protein [Streptomyces sp. NBC_00035]|uniref:hypothetical protein n=1 Tax=Streptomyces sp. NBC_00035 TaxID=2903614 RepID=UPI0032516C0C